MSKINELNDGSRGLFITFEGNEGAGKSTIIRHVEAALKKRSFPVICTREPGGTPFADQIREFFAHPPADEKLSVAGEVFLISAARRVHLDNKVLPALMQGKIVLCDRYVDSFRVYQSAFSEEHREFFEQIITVSTDGLEPDLTILLDISPEGTQERMKKDSESGKRTKLTRFDQSSLGELEKIRQGFLTLAREYPWRFRKYDAELSPDELCQKIMSDIELLITKHQLNKK